MVCILSLCSQRKRSKVTSENVECIRRNSGECRSEKIVTENLSSLVSSLCFWGESRASIRVKMGAEKSSCL